MDTTVLILLERLAWTSVQTAALVGLVALLCRALPSLSAATRCQLWWLVSLQAVLGLLWLQPLQLAWLLAPAPLPVPAVPATLTALPDGAAGLATASSLPWWALASVALWLAGVLLVALRTVGEWRRSRALLAAARPCSDAALVDALQLAAEAHGLRRAPRLWTSERIDAPQIVGPLRPVLLLPVGSHALQGDALDLALTHELQHLQRRDLQWGLLPALAQHLFFFHPLLRLAVREYAQAREEAVDSAVIAGQGDCRQDYGRLLLQLGVAPRPHVGVASAAPSMGSLKRRVQSLQPRKACPKVVATALTLAVLAVGVAPLRLVAAPTPPAPPLPPAAPKEVVPLAPAEPAAPPAAPVIEPPAAPSPPSAPSAPVPQPASTHAASSTAVADIDSRPLGSRPLDGMLDGRPLDASLKALDSQMATLSKQINRDITSSLDAAQLANLASLTASDAMRIHVPRALAIARVEAERGLQQARRAQDAEMAADRRAQRAEMAAAQAERQRALDEAAVERANAYREADAERAQAFAEAKRERDRALAEAARDRAEAQAEAARERAQEQAEARAEREQALAVARAERAARDVEARERARDRSNRE
ncbi:MAG: Regulatory protein BlaR1 [Stenotrophomonas maltophilia]|uniref:Regulatory protein BlaR1 n=1 Tax=Stenotrophomonas maltophilia TaxID=40324 RepID=A0A7V8JKF4_STEMA|nr:MAG: Regulatory protein BlaR1 [Stenotrophomonas maltophilia]